MTGARSRAFTNVAIGTPYLFDIDTFMHCADGLPDYQLALGTCDAPSPSFDAFIDLTSVVPPAAVCVRKYGAGLGGIDLSVLRFDATTLDFSIGQETSVLRVEFSSGIPSQIDISGLEAGQTYRLIITVTDGNTVPITTAATFAHQHETRMVFAPPNSPPHASIVSQSTVECAGPSGGAVTLDASTSTDPDSSPGTNDDILAYEWARDPGQPAEQPLGSGPVLSVTLPLGSHTIGLRVTDSKGVTSVHLPSTTRCGLAPRPSRRATSSERTTGSRATPGPISSSFPFGAPEGSR